MKAAAVLCNDVVVVVVDDALLVLLLAVAADDATDYASISCCHAGAFDVAVVTYYASYHYGLFRIFFCCCWQYSGIVNSNCHIVCAFLHSCNCHSRLRSSVFDYSQEKQQFFALKKFLEHWAAGN